jgi:uncharacterized membrane protein YhiD involved in acid resistance
MQIWLADPLLGGNVQSLVSKYGFGDVLSVGTIVLDPWRVAAQIVSGVGFLGAGIIITRRGAVRGLTTAAAVWESAAVGMAVGAGLLLLAVAVLRAEDDPTEFSDFPGSRRTKRRHPLRSSR